MVFVLLRLACFAGVLHVQINVQPQMAPLAHMLQVVEIAARRVALAGVRRCQDNFSFGPFRGLAIQFTASARPGGGLVKPAFAVTLATVSAPMAHLFNYLFPIRRIVFRIPRHKFIPSRLWGFLPMTELIRFSQSADESGNDLPEKSGLRVSFLGWCIFPVTGSIRIML